MRRQGRRSVGRTVLHAKEVSWVYDTLLAFYIFSEEILPVCVCVWHITLQMTLLDCDGPLNYSILMQSPVNTLNQAAKAEADYPSSCLFPHLAQPLVNSFSLTLRVCFCFICFTSFWFHLILILNLKKKMSLSLSCKHFSCYLP